MELERKKKKDEEWKEMKNRISAAKHKRQEKWLWSKRFHLNNSKSKEREKKQRNKNTQIMRKTWIRNEFVTFFFIRCLSRARTHTLILAPISTYVKTICFGWLHDATLFSRALTHSLSVRIWRIFPHRYFLCFSPHSHAFFNLNVSKVMSFLSMSLFLLLLEFKARHTQHQANQNKRELYNFVVDDGSDGAAILQ